MKVAVIRVEHFNAAHRLYRKDWDDAKNLAVFGLCSNPLYHGHNYKLEVRVSGDIDPETGYVIDLKILKQIIAEEVIEKFDHRNLNEDTVEFCDLNPTAENIAAVIYNKLRRRLDQKYEMSVRLSETERNIVEYPVGSE